VQPKSIALRKAARQKEKQCNRNRLQYNATDSSATKNNETMHVLQTIVGAYPTSKRVMDKLLTLFDAHPTLKSMENAMQRQ
jgi:hypothetical protein